MRNSYRKSELLHGDFGLPDALGREPDGLNSAQRGSGCARFGTGTVRRNCRCPDKSSAPQEQDMPEKNQDQGLAVVTGASTGIGYELAKACARKGFDLIVVADEPRIHGAADEIKALGAKVESLEADLSTIDGVDKLVGVIGARPVAALLANAGRGLGKGFLDQDFADILRVLDTNITGTLYLIQTIGRKMRDRGAGRILITGSIAGFIPGAYQAVYNASKAFLDSFSFALRAELKDRGVTVTCLMPGATETEFFERADLMDTKIGQSKKDDPADVASMGFEAMMKGEGDVVSGWHNKLRAAIANVVPAGILAEQHRKQAEPGSAS
jgi:short-subunit dehydrogenase